MFFKDVVNASLWEEKGITELINRGELKQTSISSDSLAILSPILHYNASAF